MSTRTHTQEDPIGLAGGLNLYGFAGGDPINFSDPFGLCKDENGEERPCTVTWADDYEGQDRGISDATWVLAQQLADAADADLTLGSGLRNTEQTCQQSLHECGTAFDIIMINGRAIGSGGVFNEGMSKAVGVVQEAARGFDAIRENYGPAGLWRNEGAGVFEISSKKVLGGHLDHIHIGGQRSLMTPMP